jgi:hypothetical protein
LTYSLCINDSLEIIAGEKPYGSKVKLEAPFLLHGRSEDEELNIFMNNLQRTRDRIERHRFSLSHSGVQPAAADLRQLCPY